MFRGWLLSAIARKFNVTLAVILSSAVFCLLHYGPGQPWLVTLNLVLFALVRLHLGAADRKHLGRHGLAFRLELAARNRIRVAGHGNREWYAGFAGGVGAARAGLPDGWRARAGGQRLHHGFLPGSNCLDAPAPAAFQGFARPSTSHSQPRERRWPMKLRWTLALLAVLGASPAYAQEDLQEVVVTGMREEASVPGTSLKRPGDFILLNVQVSNDSRDAKTRTTEITETLRAMLRPRRPRQVHRALGHRREQPGAAAAARFGHARADERQTAGHVGDHHQRQDTHPRAGCQHLRAGRETSRFREGNQTGRAAPQSTRTATS